MITVREITPDNFWDCVSLEVDDSQKEFVTSNAVSLAQSKYQPECIPLAVYDDETMVGFLMYCIDADDGEYWIYRMMIGKQYQGQGFGKAVLRLLIDRIKQDTSRHKILLGVHRESRSAVKLYTGFGFAFNGQVFGSEHIMVLEY